MSVAATLSVLVPSEEETDLLTACLQDGALARAAWQRWNTRHAGDDASFCERLAVTRTLLPLLARAAEHHGLEMTAGVAAYVRAAALRERLRSERYLDVAVGALQSLVSADVNAIVLRGAALAASVYPDWSLRHCHDLDLLVERAQLSAAVSALSAAGAVPVPAGTREGAVLRHASGMEFRMHTHPFAVPYYQGPVERFTRNRGAIGLSAATAQMLSTEAMLVHVLGHATYSSSRRTLRWVCDAWYILAATSLSWPAVVALVETCRLSLPFELLLRYMAGLGGDVPAEVLATVHDSAVRSPRVAEDVAIGGALAARSGQLSALWRSTTTSSGRRRLVRWFAAPSRDYVRSTYAVRSGWKLPLYYAYRPVRFAAGRLRVRFSRTRSHSREARYAEVNAG